jgi:oxepin-CoA hydrolase/3-oxo-5,6-dehydrosuberyl-CoA semialdehyde dehydrogenase
MALGKIEKTLITAEERLEKYQDSLWNYKGMPKNVKLPFLKQDEAETLRYATFEEAKEAFLNSIDETNNYFVENPDGTLFNPTFGDLNAYEWKLLQRKHFDHHFKQFGLV